MAARVLLVDDLAFMRALLRDALTAAGFAIAAEAADGHAGLIAYAAHRPDVVLLDVTMPVMDGIAMLQRLLRYDRAARVVMCSALDDADLIIKAIRLGAVDYVVKPFQAQRVVSAVTKALARRVR